MFGYINCYTRVVCKKEDCSSIEYANVHGTFENKFTKSCFEKYANQIINCFTEKGWNTVDIYACTEEEYETGIEEYTDIIGYLNIFFKVYAKNEEEEIVQYFNINSDFANFFDGSLFSSITATLKNFYLQNGFSFVNVSTCTKEEYDTCSSENQKIYKLGAEKELNA